MTGSVRGRPLSSRHIRHQDFVCRRHCAPLGEMADDMEEVRKQVRSLVQELRDADPVVAAAGERP